MLEVQVTPNGEFFIRFTSDEAQRRGLKAGDLIDIIAVVPPSEAEASADRMLTQHAETFDFLKDK